ncbi:stage V sporulation protein B [Inediibacterium massiliense]|uniref:stage V sporulation protein B n=1 Tax=Inediibacterium massiliense TaxID=1658111 RepID=UPI0006B4573A|nr:stage V sporulation protein B [Inediibacterium massiliense]
MRKNSFIYATFVLVIVNFIVRFLGFAYKIFLSRMIGAEGIGIFHLVFPILMILITFTTAGIPVAVSKLTAHYSSLHDEKTCRKILKTALVLGLFISTILCIFLILYAKHISFYFIKNKDTYESLIVLPPAIIFITLSSIFRGYYYGIKNVEPPGVSQILEQIMRIAFVLGSLYLLSPLEMKYASMIAVIGIAIGELAGLLWLIFKFQSNKNIHIPSLQIKNTNKKLLGKIIYISLPITLTRLIAVVMQSINAVLIPQRLQLAGYSLQSAITTFGKITGMAMPLLFLPFIVTSALVVNIIPSVSEEMALKNFRDIRLKSHIAIRITLLIALPIMGVFLFFSKPICSFLYDVDYVDQYLSYLSYGTVFLCLHHTVSGILHGMGKQVVTTIHHLIGTMIQLFCTYYLVANPSFAENGFILGFILSTAIICILNIKSLNHFMRLDFHFLNHILKPILATIIMIFSIKFTYAQCIRMDCIPFINISLSMGIGFIVYISIIILSKSINFETLKWIITKK